MVHSDMNVTAGTLAGRTQYWMQDARSLADGIVQRTLEAVDCLHGADSDMQSHAAVGRSLGMGGLVQGPDAVDLTFKER